MKRYKNLRKVWIKNRFLFYSLCFGLLGVYCFQSLIETYKYYEADQTYKRLEQVIGINSDNKRYKEEILIEELNMIGWITIEQLDISYPVVQGEDNEFYLQHLVNGKSNPSGSIMLNCDNLSNFSDRNTIIYGHNMKDGSMFGKLEQLEKLSEPYEFQIATADGELRYHIFAIANVEVSHPIYQINYEEESFQYCMQELKRAASYWEEPEGVPEHIITLSTCMEERRLIVVACLVSPIF